MLIVAELSTCPEMMRGLLELQDQFCIQMIGGAENGVDALQATEVLLPDLIILDYRQDLGPTPLRSVLASNFPAIKLLVFAEEFGAATLFTILNQSLAKEIEEPTFMSMQGRPWRAFV